MDYPFDQKTKEILNILQKNLSEGEKIYLVGGMVRDILMSQPIHDHDFVFVGDVRKYAIKIADLLGAAFFMLNDKYKTARIINRDENPSWKNIDMIQMRGNSIEEDLRQRDITINAIAIDVELQNKLIDPLSGALHLHQKLLVACSTNSFIDDPIRVLRAIRQSTTYQWRIEAKTLKLMKQACVLIPNISLERKRDELMRILDLQNPMPALNLLDHLGLLEIIFPDNKDFRQNWDVESHFSFTNWEEIKLILKNLLLLEKALVLEYQPGNAIDLRTGQVVMKLGRFRAYLSDFFEKRIHTERSLRSLLFLTVILSRNKFTINTRKDNDENYQNLLFGFDKSIRKFVLTNEEIKLASIINANREMIHVLAVENEELNGGEVYQFFRKLGAAGILLCFLILAETMSSVNQVFPEKQFNSELQICRTLMTGYFQKSDEWINPPSLVDGYDLKKIIHENEAIFIGEWLEKVRIATAEGTLSNKAEAIQYVKKNYLQSSDNI